MRADAVRARSNDAQLQRDASLRASVIAARQAEADPSYEPIADAAGLHASNAAAQLALEFGRDGVHVSAQQATDAGFDLELTKLGRADALEAVPRADAPSVQHTRVEYRRGSLLREWYVNGPLGLEQGFTLAQRPSGTQPLRLELKVGAGVTARMAADGASVLFEAASGAAVGRYSELYVHDAEGRVLRSQLSASGDTLAISVDDEQATYPLVIDPLVQRAELSPLDKNEFDIFGWSVAVNGSTAVVGAWGQSDSTGAVYVFVRSGSAWQQQQKILPPSGSGTGIQFGYAVSVSLTTLAIGAPEDSGTGAVFVYVRSGTTWSLQQKLSGTTADDALGQSVALDNNILVAGAPNDGSRVGSAYAYTRLGTTWSRVTLPTPTGTLAADGFGFAVALDGTTAAVGAPGASSERGAAYIFVQSGGTWTLQQKLTGQGGGIAGEAFGQSLALDVDTVVVGGPGNFSSVKGAAYMFRRAGATWTQQARFADAAGAAIDGYGAAVAVSGEQAAVSSYHKYGYAGSLFFYRRSGTTWSFVQEFRPSNGMEDAQFGVSIATDGVTWLVGANGQTVSNITFAGTTYALDAVDAVPALAGSGVLPALLLILLVGVLSLVRTRRFGAVRG